MKTPITNAQKPASESHYPMQATLKQLFTVNKDSYQLIRKDDGHIFYPDQTIRVKGYKQSFYVGTLVRIMLDGDNTPVRARLKKMVYRNRVGNHTVKVARKCWEVFAHYEGEKIPLGVFRDETKANAVYAQSEQDITSGVRPMRGGKE